MPTVVPYSLGYISPDLDFESVGITLIFLRLDPNILLVAFIVYRLGMRTKQEISEMENPSLSSAEQLGQSVHPASQEGS